MLTFMHVIKSVNIVKYNHNLKKNYFNIFSKCNLFLWCQSWIFSIIIPVISVSCFFRNHSNMMICCSRNISDYYQCSKQLCCLIFLWKLWYLLKNL